MPSSSSSDEGIEEPEEIEKPVKKTARKSSENSSRIATETNRRLPVCFGCESDEVEMYKNFNQEEFCRECFLATISQRHLCQDRKELKKYSHDMKFGTLVWRQRLKQFRTKPTGKCRNSAARSEFRRHAKVVVFFIP